jgi:glutathione gamma-glutamylcysteinyltransferase
MVLNALQVDPQKRWKGIWRWYSEDVLHCSDTDVMKLGLSLE